MGKHFAQPDNNDKKAPASHAQKLYNDPSFDSVVVEDGEVLIRHRHKVKRHHPGRVVALVVLIVFLVLVVAGGAFGISLYRSAMTAKSHINAVVDTASSLADGDLTAALANMDSSVETIQSEAAAAKDEVSGPLWNVAAKLPVVGSDISSVQKAADVLDDFSTTTLPELQDMATTLTAMEFSDGNGGLNLEPIITVAAKLTTVDATLQEQADAINALPDATVPQIQDALGKGKTKLTTLAGTISSLSDLVNMMPSFLGKDGQRNYVLIAQTNSEIRSAGGLCGSLGSVTANNGSINVGDFHADTEFSVGNAGEYVGENQSTLWSGLSFGYDIMNISLSPDFSQVAKMAARFWQQQSFGFEQVDGVMSLDPVALGTLLDVTGSVTLSDGRVLDSSNAADFLLNGVYKEVDIAQTDAYFAETAAQVVHNTFSNMSASKLVGLARKMIELAENRHVYFWSFHDEDVETLREAGFTHEITDDAANPFTGLYLYEVKASKIDYYCKRSVVVNRTKDDEAGAQYHVTATFTNTLQPSQVDSEPDYIKGNSGDSLKVEAGSIWDECIVFAPAGGSVSNITMSTGQEFTQIDAYNRACYKASLIVTPGSTETVEWDVTTAAGANPLAFDQTPQTNTTESGVTYNY